jgi:hypothetical protein
MVTFGCPTNCPQNLCNCFKQSQGDLDLAIFAICAPEIHSVCIDGLFSECYPGYGHLREHPPIPHCSLAACYVEGCTITSEYYKDNDFCQAYYALEEDIDRCEKQYCCSVQAMEQLYGNTTVSAAPTPPPSDPPMVSPVPMTTSAPMSSSVLTTVPSVAPMSSPRGAPTVAASTPTTASSGRQHAAHRLIVMAAFAASLFFSAGGAFWIFA